MGTDRKYLYCVQQQVSSHTVSSLLGSVVDVGRCRVARCATKVERRKTEQRRSTRTLLRIPAAERGHRERRSERKLIHLRYDLNASWKLWSCPQNRMAELGTTVYISDICRQGHEQWYVGKDYSTELNDVTNTIMYKMLMCWVCGWWRCSSKPAQALSDSQSPDRVVVTGAGCLRSKEQHQRRRRF
jgi:hypothetical protein